VPELASREHLEKIVPVVTEAFERAQVTAADIDGIAVTVGPGLVGSLLVGVSYAKAMAYALKKPFVGVNHIEGHIYSVAFENPPIEYPAEALIVSGGHTNIFFIPEPGKYKVVSRTRDDAAGEAFDKVAKMLGLGYPGGPVIERLAREGDPHAVSFSIPRMGDGLPDFSFSGLKTAVTKHVRETGLAPVENGGEPSQGIKDLAARFQHVVVQSLVRTPWTGASGGASAALRGPRVVVSLICRSPRFTGRRLSHGSNPKTGFSRRTRNRRAHAS